MTTNDTMRKIEALLRLAAKAGTPEEAASAAAKAAELALKNGIDLQKMGTAESRSFETDASAGYAANDTKWIGIIAYAVALINACKGAFVDGTDGKAHCQFVGRMGNATNAKVQLEYLVTTVNRLNREHVAGRGFEKAELRRHRHAFRLGAASALAEILKKKYEEMRLSGLPQGANALVVAGYFDQEQAALDAHVGGRYKSKQVSVVNKASDREAYMAGAVAAAGIGLDKQVATATRNNKMIGG